MLIEQIVFSLALFSAIGPSSLLPALPHGSKPPSFLATERSVNNWRREAAFNLNIDGAQAVSIFLGRNIKGLSRCVRLNNYWCVKKAGWQGEIASDSEGHVAFASAQDGAAVAAILLRRYYSVYNLKSARAIVQRWAPAQCGMGGLASLNSLGAGARTRITTIGSAMGAPARPRLGPKPQGTVRPLARGLTTRGLGNTVRARYLAARGRGIRIRTAGKGKNAAGNYALIRSPAPSKALTMLKTPSISVGFGEEVQPIKLAMLRFQDLPSKNITSSALALPPLSSCASDTQRIANYATKIAAGIADGPDADLALFDEAGQPRPNLARALFNMSAVEIGPLGAKQALIDAIIAGGLPPQKPAEKAAASTKSTEAAQADKP